MTVSFRTNAATVDQLADHFRRCDDGYVPSLSDRVTIDAYAMKIAAKATRFEAWVDGGLVGLVAAYPPNAEGAPVFISDVSVVPSQRGKRIASALLDACEAFARAHSDARIRLNVDRRNEKAIRLYEARGFDRVELVGDTVAMELAAGIGASR